MMTSETFRMIQLIHSCATTIFAYDLQKIKIYIIRRLNQKSFESYLLATLDASSVYFLGIHIANSTAHSLHQKVRQTVHFLFFTHPAGWTTRSCHCAAGTAHVRSVQGIVRSRRNLTWWARIDRFVNRFVCGRGLEWYLVKNGEIKTLSIETLIV